MRKAIETLKNIWKIEDLRQRILITILFVAIYRFGSYVVLPGINPSMLTQLHQQTSEGLLALLNMFSGGAFSNASIFALGIVAFAFAAAGGVLVAKIMNFFLKDKINPLIGAAGVSAVPMAARVAQKMGQEANPKNFLLMHAMGPNVSGVIGTAVAAGTFITLNAVFASMGITFGPGV